MSHKRTSSVSIFIPISILSDVPSLVEKTFKVGQIARAASIFRVERIIIYLDGPGSRREDAFLIRDLLSYVETPQYLRKRLFPISESFKYAGMLPPLRTPHHPLESTDIAYREGFVLRSSKGGSIIDVGLRSPVESPARLMTNARVTMKLVNGSWLPAPRNEVPYYWGFSISLEFKSLKQLLEIGGHDQTIATSRLGEPFASVAARLKGILVESKKLALLFGSSHEGLHEILAREGARLEDYADLVINTAPDQGTATIRTEEAVMITLAVMNALDDFNCSSART